MHEASRRDVVKFAGAGALVAASAILLPASAGAVPLPKGPEIAAREESLVEEARWRWPWSRRRRRHRYYGRRRRRWWW